MPPLDFKIEEIQITHTQPEHGPGIYDVIRLAFLGTDQVECDGCIDADDVRVQLQRFPEGHFVALHGEKVVGVAITMRTHYPPDKPPLKWLEVLGDLTIRNHEPDGDWLYGVEMAVRPAYQGYGVGTRLYEARFDLVKRLNLRGWYAVGMLMGYRNYRDQMSVREYGEKVIARQIKDPTVTMQMNRGFEAWGVVENYMHEPPAGDSGVLIVWKNPDYSGG